MDFVFMKFSLTVFTYILACAAADGDTCSLFQVTSRRSTSSSVTRDNASAEFQKRCCCQRRRCHESETSVTEVEGSGAVYCCGVYRSLFGICKPSWWKPRYNVEAISGPSLQYDSECKLQCRGDCGTGKKPVVVHDGLKQTCGCTRAGVFSPFNKSSRIAIVGAGPAGVHIASRLKKLGYDNLTLLERTKRVGGKSYTIYRDPNGTSCTQTSTATKAVDTTSCIAYEMGTCYLHNGYQTVRSLVDEYDLTPEVVPEGRAIFSRYTADQWHAEELSDYIVNSIKEGIKHGTVSVPAWANIIPDLAVFVALLDGIEKYIDLHEDLFGKIEFSMPERPHFEKLKKISMSFSDFLEMNGLHVIKGFLEFAHTAQGYGYVKSIPAFYGLTWISPELLNGYIQQTVHEKMEDIITSQTSIPRSVLEWWAHKVANVLVGGDAQRVRHVTTMLPEGYGKIWPTIVERDGLKVLHGVEIGVGGIDRQVDDAFAPVLITYKHDDKFVTEEYDFLIYTAAHAHAHKYVKDLAEVEASTFSKLSSYVLSTTLYESDAVADFTDAASNKPIMYNTEKMRGPETEGGWYTDRWEARIKGEQGGLFQDRQTRVGYQFLENACSMDSSLCDSDRVADPYMEQATELRSKFLQDLESQRVTNVELIRQFPWPYFHHYGGPEVASGVPWDVIDMQGHRKTWWLGASAFFESVHDVTNYNLMIMNKYLGARFDKDGRPN